MLLQVASWPLVRTAPEVATLHLLLLGGAFWVCVPSSHLGSLPPRRGFSTCDHPAVSLATPSHQLLASPGDQHAGGGLVGQEILGPCVPRVSERGCSGSPIVLMTMWVMDGDPLVFHWEPLSMNALHGNLTLPGKELHDLGVWDPGFPLQCLYPE